MLYPIIESANPSVAIAESSAAFLQRQHDNLREVALPAAPQARDEEPSSPVCAARWAY
jgi:hypothetical protein